MSKVYYIKIEDTELEKIELLVRKQVVQMITREIADHSKVLAKQIIEGKPLTKKRWYEPTQEEQ